MPFSPSRLPVPERPAGLLIDPVHDSCQDPRRRGADRRRSGKAASAGPWIGGARRWQSGGSDDRRRLAAAVSKRRRQRLDLRRLDAELRAAATAAAAANRRWLQARRRRACRGCRLPAALMRGGVAAVAISRHHHIDRGARALRRFRESIPRRRRRNGNAATLRCGCGVRRSRTKTIRRRGPANSSSIRAARAQNRFIEISPCPRES